MLNRLGWLFIFAVLSLVTSVVSVRAWRAYDSKHWPTTEGVVVAYFGNPDYKYSVGGTSYTSSYVSCNEFFDHYLAIRNSSKYAEKYPLQSKVSVHYRPADPALAVLETEFNARILLVVGVLVLATSFCAAGVWFGWRGRSRWRV